MIWAPQRGLSHFPSSAFCSIYNLFSRLRLVPIPQLRLPGGHSWSWHLQKFRCPLMQLSCTFTDHLSQVLHLYHALTSLSHSLSSFHAFKTNTDKILVRFAPSIPHSFTPDLLRKIMLKFCQK